MGGGWQWSLNNREGWDGILAMQRGSYWSGGSGLLTAARTTFPPFLPTFIGNVSWVTSCLFRLNVNNIQETCQKNAASALAVGRRDLVQVCHGIRPLPQHAVLPSNGSLTPKRPPGFSSCSRESLLGEPGLWNSHQGGAHLPDSGHQEIPSPGYTQILLCHLPNWVKHIFQGIPVGKVRNAACFWVIKWSNCAHSCLAAVSILIHNFFCTYVIVPIVWHSSVLALGANCSYFLPREPGPRGPKMGLAICLQLKIGEKWLLWPMLFPVISPLQQAMGGLDHLTGHGSTWKRWELAVPQELCKSPQHLALPRAGQATCIGLPDLSRSWLKLLSCFLVGSARPAERM